MTVAETIERKLRAAFDPAELQVIDQSHLHAGHRSAPEGGESHFRIRIVSSAFVGQTRLARQRAINAVLREELEGPVHALSIDAQVPDA